MGSALQFISLGLTLLPQAMAAARDVTTLVGMMKEVADGGQDPTPEQWDKLHAYEASLRGKLHSDEE